jgi:BirA family biotin operon repressor/biotin-[acetyl-CoA-carboxylase] ligase
MSVLLFTPPHLHRPALVVSWAAICVCDVVEALTGLVPTIKWPNDVLVHGKKVCGILIEQRNSGDQRLPLTTVVGIGLNVTQPAEAFAAANLPQAGSLYSVSDRSLDTGAVAHQLIRRLDAEYDRILRRDFAGLEASWKQRLGLHGKRVRVETFGDDRVGELRDVTLNSVQLELAPGEVLALPPEQVRHVEPI